VQVRSVDLAGHLEELVNLRHGYLLWGIEQHDGTKTMESARA